MAKIDKGLRDILDKYKIDYQDKSKLWDCHGTLVLYHKAYEIIAAQESIVFNPPQIVEADSKNRVVCVCVTGKMGDRTEWSFGEAAPGNNKNTYPYAMAEKRAKDRVIAKLVGLAQYVYSEDEADEFKDSPRHEVQRPVDDDELSLIVGRIRAAGTLDELNAERENAKAAKPRMTKPQQEAVASEIGKKTGFLSQSPNMNGALHA